MPGGGGDDASENFEWMWGDAGFLGHGPIARLNPLRWSKPKSPQGVAEELEAAAQEDKYDAVRPVIIRDSRSKAERRYDNVAAAVAAMRTTPASKDAKESAKSKEADADIARLILPDGRVHEIKVLTPTLGSDSFLDIRDLHAKTGYFTFDPGFTCTGSCMSAITFIDGPKGVCLYRGYPVQDLCEKSTALESAYLLLKGDLPSEEELETFTGQINEHMMVHERVVRMFSNFSVNAHPMAIMVAVIGGLSTVFSELDCMDEEHRWLACMRCVAKLPVLAAMAYKTSLGQPIMQPRADLTFAENWLYMMFGTPMRDYVVNPVHAKAIDAFMILHMDHEQNASTSTVRTAGSSQANPYACIAAGVASLWGPAHGGANEAVIKMLEQIGKPENVPQFVEDVKAKKAGVRLMGFGHRVYKNYDPRARFMKELVDKSLPEMGVDDPLLAVAKALEEVALSDDYFGKRKLYPNVDYYSGILLRAIGIPTSMFTVMFAMSRTVGWMSQWNEMVAEGQMRISRPRQLYAGVVQREYIVRAARSLDTAPQGDDVPRRRPSVLNVQIPDTVTR